MQAAKLLQRELQYQIDGLTSTTERGFADVVSVIQSTCDYLGGQLCEVRWAIERQTQVSQQLLHVLLTSLDNTSRQYYEQGVKWYEDSEYDLAKERLQLALKENSRNYFAYQYLGFIAVNREESQEALRNFELARKAAENDYHKALALSHLARSYNAVGELPKALQCSTSATQAAPDHAKFWYESAVYYVRSGITNEAVKCLRRAISTDWMYWSISGTDSNLEPIQHGVEGLLSEMREEQRTIARKCLDQVKQMVATLAGMQIGNELAHTRTFSQCESQYREGTVFAYRDLVPIAQQAQKKALEAAIQVTVVQDRFLQSEIGRVPSYN
jgi:tetratricopeptide (TPR) repeat protein